MADFLEFTDTTTYGRMYRSPQVVTIQRRFVSHCAVALKAAETLVSSDTERYIWQRHRMYGRGMLTDTYTYISL